MAENHVWGLLGSPVLHTPNAVVCNCWAFSRYYLKATKSVPTPTAVIKTNDLFFSACQNELNSIGNTSQHLLFWRVKVFWSSLEEPEDFITLWNVRRKTDQCLQNVTRKEKNLELSSSKHGLKHLNYQARGGKTVLTRAKQYKREASHLATYLRRKEIACLSCKCQVGWNELRQGLVLRVS